MRKAFLLAIPLLILAAACSSADTPAAKCTSLEDVFCLRAVECKVYATNAACETDFAKSITCSQVKSVSTSYDKCKSDLKSAACDDLLGLFSTSCKGVLLI